MIAVLRTRAFGFLFALSAVAITTAYAQSSYGDAAVRVGTLLVATEKLGDPNFAETVVLIVHQDAEEGAVGIIINHRSDFPLSRIFPHIKSAPADPVFLGGPVGRTSGQALIRLDGKSDNADRISGDVYITAAKDLIEKTVDAHTPPARFRLYLGYAGWAPDQLNAEIRLGAWLLFPATPALIFDDDPDSLWSRLIRRSQMQVASLCPEVLSLTAAQPRAPASVPLSPPGSAP